MRSRVCYHAGGLGARADRTRCSGCVRPDKGKMAAKHWEPSATNVCGTIEPMVDVIALRVSTHFGGENSA